MVVVIHTRRSSGECLLLLLFEAVLWQHILFQAFFVCLIEMQRNYYITAMNKYMQYNHIFTLSIQFLSLLTNAYLMYTIQVPAISSY